VLVLSRKPGEIIDIDGGKVVVEVLEVKTVDGKPLVKLGITAPAHIKVHRREVSLRIEQEGPRKKFGQQQTETTNYVDSNGEV
jgi:carbon storage regulator